MDAFHANGKNLYQVYERQYFDHNVKGQYYTPGVLAAEMKLVFPDVKYAVNAVFDEWHTFKVGDKIISRAGGAADVDFFKMFSYPLVLGKAQSALNNLSGIALSQKWPWLFSAARRRQWVKPLG